MRFPVLVHGAGSTYSAHSPDVPGCIAAGDSPEDAIASYREALTVHIWALKQVGGELPVPETVLVSMVEVEDPA